MTGFSVYVPPVAPVRVPKHVRDYGLAHIRGDVTIEYVRAHGKIVTKTKRWACVAIQESLTVYFCTVTLTDDGEIGEFVPRTPLHEKGELDEGGSDRGLVSTGSITTKTSLSDTPVEL